MAADCHVLRFGSGAAADSQHTDLVFQSGSLSVGQGPWFKGLGSQRSCHCKAVVVDCRCLCCGSPNLSSKSHKNAKLCWQITGPAVGQVLQQLIANPQRKEPWDGC